VRRFVLPFDRGLTVFLQRLEFLLQVGESDDSPVYVRLSKNGGETFGEKSAKRAAKGIERKVRLYLAACCRASWLASTAPS
jgi:hypothetical protein